MANIQRGFKFKSARYTWLDIIFYLGHWRIRFLRIIIEFDELEWQQVCELYPRVLR